MSLTGREPIDPQRERRDREIQKLSRLFQISIDHFYSAARDDAARLLVINAVTAHLNSFSSDLKRQMRVGCPSGMVECEGGRCATLRSGCKGRAE